MTHLESSTPNRAQQVWSHFSGLFGADRLKRKFGPSPPREWESALTYLTEGQLRHGFDVTLRSGSADVPSLPEFLLSCRQAREWTDVDEFGEVKKIPSPNFDKWAIEANDRLQKYPHMIKFAPDSSHDGRTLTIGPLTRKYTAILVGFKNAWAEDMRADDKGDGIPIEQQQEAWADCMARAELAIMPAETHAPRD